jgi:succinate dehydrogenase / fumarate reductase cytochrome b subunit
MGQKMTYPNRLGLMGWLTGGRWGLERYLYVLHRFTGLGMLLYLFVHVLVTSARAFGRGPWERWMGIFESSPFLIGEFLVFVAFAFHAVNGLRLILIELGLAVGRPEEPIYPYRSSLNTQRPLVVVAMIVVAILVAMGGYEFLGLSH